MMPLAPTMTELPTPTRPKIGFSIDSIVGGKTQTHNNNNNRSPSPSPQNHKRQRRDSPEHQTDHDRDGSYRSHSSSPETPPISAAGHLHRSQLLGNYSPAALAFFRDSYLKSNVIVNHNSDGQHHHQHQHQRRRSPDSVHSNASSSPTASPLVSPKITTTVTSNSVIKGPGPVSPVISGSGTNTSASASSTTATNNNSTSIHPQHPQPEIHHPPFSLLGGAPHGAVPYPPGILNFAALAAAAAQQHGPHPGQHPLAWMQQAHFQQQHPHHPPGHPLHHHHVGPGIPGGGPHTHPPMSTSHPLYPWLLAKHSRLFPHRFGPGGPELPGFLLQPFRKPKRIRTAFSPSQLLKLEHAFERNHYVVGAERKQLANNLSLTETQVKVWFQNRRTKHKRMEQDEEPGPGTNSSSKSGMGGNGNHGGGGGGSSSTATADSSTNARHGHGGRYMMSGDEDDDIDEDDEDEDVLMDDEEEEAERQAYLARIAAQQQQLHSTTATTVASTASQIPSSSSQSPSSSSPAPGSNNSNHHNLNHYPHPHHVTSRRPS